MERCEKGISEVLRITELPKDSSVVELKLEGAIVSEWISLLERQCTRLLQEGKSVRLDFSEVRFIDSRAIDKLLRFDTQRLRIVRCPSSIQDLIDECKRPDQAPDRCQREA